MTYKNSAVAEMAEKCYTCRILAFDGWYLSLTHCFSVISENITVFHTLPKPDSLSYMSIATIMGLTSTTVT